MEVAVGVEFTNFDAVLFEAGFHIWREGSVLFAECADFDLIATINKVFKNAAITRVVRGKLEVGCLSIEAREMRAKDRL